MKISRVTRVVKILTALQSQKSCTADDLAGMFSISRRTVFRDLKDLAAVGVPYKYDQKKQTYSVDPEFFLPPIDLNLTEALSLLLLAHKTASQIQLPFRKSALMAALKIENNLPAKIRTQCDTTLKAVTTKMPAQAGMSKLDSFFATLQTAVTRKQKLNLQYDSFFDKQIITTQICPYHLMYHHRAWYLLAHSAMHKSIRTFKLNRIKNLTQTGKCYVTETPFDINDYLGRAWALIPEGTLYNIKLLFLPKVARNVAEVQWHPTQKTTFNPDGTLTAEFRIDGLEEIKWWILGYGDQVKVITPKKLKEKILQTAKNMIKINEET